MGLAQLLKDSVNNCYIDTGVSRMISYIGMYRHLGFEVSPYFTLKVVPGVDRKV
jgi:hypothetical protein